MPSSWRPARGLLAGQAVWALGLTVLSAVDLYGIVPFIALVSIVMYVAQRVADARGVRRRSVIIVLTLVIGYLVSILMTFVLCAVRIGYCPL